MIDNRHSSAFSQLSSSTFLEYAWGKLNRGNSRSCGVDGETIGHFAARLRPKLKDLAKSLRDSRFTFHPLKGVTILKDESQPRGPKRPLRIPTVKDRIVLKSLQLLLEPRLAPYNAPFSYAYKSNAYQFKGGTFRAIAHARRLTRKYKFVLEADIQSYFENVDRDKLAAVLFKVQRLSSIEPLLRSGLQLETEIGGSVDSEDYSLFENDDRGIPQGSALSPLLANLYLAYFDLRMTQAGWELLRYADDVIIFANTPEHAEKAYTESKALFNSMGLDMHALSSGSGAKTRIREIESQGVDFVGYHVKGDKITPSSKTLSKFRSDIERVTAIDSMNRAPFPGRPGRAESIISRAMRVINKVSGKAASLACCEDCQEIGQLAEVVKRRFIGMFEQVGVDLTNASPERLRLLGVPDLQESWSEHRAAFLERADEAIPTHSDALEWSKRYQSSLEAAFAATSLIVGPAQPAACP